MPRFTSSSSGTYPKQMWVEIMTMPYEPDTWSTWQEYCDYQQQWSKYTTLPEKIKQHIRLGLAALRAGKTRLAAAHKSSAAMLLCDLSRRVQEGEQLVSVVWLRVVRQLISELRSLVIRTVQARSRPSAVFRFRHRERLGRVTESERIHRKMNEDWYKRQAEAEKQSNN